MRKSILACTVSFLMSPMAGWALGMGDLQVNSSLNRPLNSEIELHSVTKKDLDFLRIGLASKSAYSRAGMERSEYLSKFRFKVIQRGGKHFVTITTRKPFREPFANFLVEASWGSGRMLREYTMLVDPPEFVKKQARPVTTAVTSRSSQVKRTVKKTTVKSTAKTTSSDYVLSPSDSVSTGELSYGPTRRNDTLWTIAKSMAPTGVSVDQMMLALLRENNDAFVNNNINNLKAGYVLRIKDVASLNKINKSTAYRQVKEQYQTWKEARKQKISNANIVDRSDRGSEEKPSSEGRLELVASGSSDATNAQGDIASQAKQLKEKLALAGEELESKEVENQELKERIKELEEIIKTKTSLVELKDESLAALQKQKEVELQQEEVLETAAEPQKSVTEMLTESQKTVTEEVVDAAQEMTGVETPAAETPVAETSLAEVPESTITEHIDPSVELAKDELTASTEQGKAVETAADVEKSAIADEAVSEALDAEPVTEPEPVPVVAETKPVVAETKPEVAETKIAVAPTAKPKDQQAKPQERPTPAPEESIVDLLTGEYLPYAAGGGAFLIVLLAWLGLRGRGKKENDFEESILDSKLVTEESDFIVEDSELSNTESSTEVLASDTETSFLSDFSSDDMESLQPDDTEADPVSEADVFMVYGRYQQAEELLKTAVKEEPERLDYQMKLLEVYHGDNQKDSFTVQADAVRDLLKQNEDDYELTSEWSKAKSWAEKLGVDIEMPDTFEEGIPGNDVEEDLDVTQKISFSDSPELSLDDSPELSLSDVSDELSLESEEISFNEDSVLGETSDTVEDDEFELTLDESLDLDEKTSELTLDDINAFDDTELESSDIEKSLQADDEFDINLDELDTDINEITEGFDASDEMFDLDESTAENSFQLEDSLELEDEDSLELEDKESTKFDESTLELEDIDEVADLDESLVTEESLELEDNLELEENPELEDNFELEENPELEDNLELEENPELEDNLELEENPELEDNLELEENPELEDNLELEENPELENNFELEDNLELGENPKLDESLALVGDTAATNIDDSILLAEGTSTTADELDLLDNDMDFDELESDFPELDAVGTKLDLAKAYIDMGDMESASSILNEVVDEGDEEQITQAQSLLSQTGT